MKLAAAVTFAFVCVLAGAANADQNSAFQDANTFAGGKTQGIFSGVSSGAVSDKIPGYGTNPSEAQFFQGGQGALSGPGVTKMQNCANYTPGQDKIANQECEAVNFLARNPDVRPQFNIGTNDPMVLGAKGSRNNAESFFQSIGIGSGTGSSTQCTTKTTTIPAQYTTETCTSLRGIEGQQCIMGREVVIDAKTNYQCVDTQNSVNAYNCKKTLSVHFPNTSPIGFTNWPATVTLADGAGGVGENFFRPVASVYLPAGAQGVIHVSGYLSVYAEKNLSIGIDKDGVMQNSALVFYCDGYCSGASAFNISANVTGGGAYRFMVYLWGAYNSDKLAGGSVTFTGNLSVCPSGYTWSASRGGCYGAPVPTWANECASFEAKAQ